ncbi:MAG TPA: hypothetical protein VK524_10685 [Polyangiaceae bacterium]|nr:hypothetical protein [Polyangiaceae bacterium]
MAEPAPPPAPRNPALLIVGAIGVFLVVIASFAAYFLWPRGERVGVLDLRAAAPSLGVDLAAGDTLNFRLDVTVGTNSSYPDSSRSRTNAVHDQLQASAVTASLVRDGSAPSSTQCGAFAGKATTVGSGSDDVASSGLPLDCSLKAPAAGRYTLTVRVAWVPKDIREAKLEVRRQRAGE